MERSELARRLKAARALAGFTKPATLAAQPLMIENRIPASRVREMESPKGRVEIRPMELEIIARACGLPAEWFTAPFDRLAVPDSSVLERLDRIDLGVAELLHPAPPPEDPGELREELDRQAAVDADAADRKAGDRQKRSG